MQEYLIPDRIEGFVQHTALFDIIWMLLLAFRNLIAFYFQFNTSRTKCAVQWRIFSRVEGYHQYSGGISSIQWRDIFSTVEDIQYCRGISSLQCSQYWKPSTVLMISLLCTDHIPPLYWMSSTVLQTLHCTAHTLPGMLQWRRKRIFGGGRLICSLNK